MAVAVLGSHVHRAWITLFKDLQIKTLELKGKQPEWKKIKPNLVFVVHLVKLVGYETCDEFQNLERSTLNRIAWKL